MLYQATISVRSVSMGNDKGLGQGFSHLYDYTLDDDRGLIRIEGPYGQRLNFMREIQNGTDTYRPLQDGDFTLESHNRDGYTMTYRNGATFRFASGLLEEIQSPGGDTIAALTYRGKELETVSNLTGTLSFTWQANHITQVKDGVGRSISYGYSGNRLCSVANPDDDLLEYEYDEKGFLSAAVDFDGNRYLENEYDEQGRVTRQLLHHAGGDAEMIVSYDDGNRRNEVATFDGSTKTYLYDEDGQITEIQKESGSVWNRWTDAFRADEKTDGENHRIRYTMDSRGNVTKAVYPDGNVVTARYDTKNRAVEKTYPDGTTEQFAYDDNGNITSWTDRGGHTTGYTYETGALKTRTDALGNVTAYQYDSQMRLTEETDALGQRKRYTYDSRGRMQSQTDWKGNETTYTYSDGGKLLSVQDAFGSVTAYAYTGNGFQTKKTDALGFTVLTEYGAGNLVLAVTDQEGYRREYQYNEKGQLERESNPAGGSIVYGYDREGRIAAVTDETGGTTTYAYNGNGQVKKTTDAYGGEQFYGYDPMGRLASTTDQNGAETTYAYDVDGNLVKETKANGDQSTYTYDSVGNRTEAKDPEGGVISYVYDACNQPIRVMDQESHTTLFQYDALGRMTQETDALGDITVHSYDENGRLLSTTDPEGNVTTSRYDVLGRLVETTDPMGATTAYTYDKNNNVLERMDALGQRTTFAYDGLGNTVKQTDPMGYTTTYAYGPFGEMETVFADQSTRKTAYNIAGLVSQTVDANGKETQYAYDLLGRRSNMIDGEGVTTGFVYDPVGNVVEEHRAGVRTVSYRYDALSRVTEEVDALGNISKKVYDGNGNITQSVDRRGNSTGYTYDKTNRLLIRTDALGHTQKSEYDALGRVIREEDEGGAQTTFTYDAAGRVLSVTDASGTGSQTYDRVGRMEQDPEVYRLYTYDKNGNRLSFENEEREVTHYTYDRRNRLVAQVDGMHHRMGYTYDGEGNLIEEIDANGNTTQYAYNSDGLVTKKTDAEGQFLAYEYDAWGNLESLAAPDPQGKTQKTVYTYDGEGNRLTQTTPLGFVTTYTYDEEQNVLTKTDPDGNCVEYRYNAGNQVEKKTADGADTVYTYTKTGQTASVVETMGTTSFTYDAAGRLTQAMDHKDNVTQYTYDENGNKTQMVYPDGKAVIYAYDADNRLRKVRDHDGTEKTYQYDRTGRLLKNDFTSGIQTSYAYDEGGRLLSVVEIDKEHKDRRKLEYSYDDKGNVTSEIRTGLDTDKHTQILIYRYDAADRLLSELDQTGTKTYAYDKAGNLTGETEQKTGAATGSAVRYTYDAQNRLTGKTSQGASTAYEYDHRGNTVKQTDATGDTTYRYNADGRLVYGKNAKGEESTYTYNGLGVRVGHTEVRSNQNRGHQNNAFAPGSRGDDKLLSSILKEGRYDWQRVWETTLGTVVQNDLETVEKEYVVDYTSPSNRDILITEKGGFTQRYLYGNDLERVSMELTRAADTLRTPDPVTGQETAPGTNPASDIAEDMTGKVIYHENRQGTTVFTTDTDGNVSTHMVVDNWGKPQSETRYDLNHSGLDNINNYTGYTYDEVLRLYYAQARFYHPDTKRFLSEDAIKDGFHWYSYCGNNPVSRVDPSGLKTEADRRVEKDIRAELQEQYRGILEEKLKSAEKHFSDSARRKDMMRGVGISLVDSMLRTGAITNAVAAQVFSELGLPLEAEEILNRTNQDIDQLMGRLERTVVYPDSYYLGRAMGDLGALGLSIGAGVVGVTTAVAGATGGAGVTVASGGLAAVAAMTAASATIAAGMAITGVAAASGTYAAGQFWRNLDQYTYYSKMECTGGAGSKHMLGEWGSQVRGSKTTGQNGKTERVDVENPAPGKRPGDVHYHESNNTRWRYDVKLEKLIDSGTGELAPPKVQTVLEEKWFQKAIEKALGILGE